VNGAARDTPSPTRWAVLGAGGQLGGEFLRVLGPRAIPLRRSDADLAAPDDLLRLLEASHPDVVVNCAAFNDVDAAESRHDAALLANFRAPAELARAAAEREWKFVHFSTDYVFGGETREQPYIESDRPSPVNFYGLSKLMGEQAALGAGRALALRVAHLFGGESGSQGRSNLVRRFLEAAERGRAIRASATQRLNPTSVRDIVPMCIRLVESEACGLYHLTGGGECTALEFAREALRLAGVAAELVDASDPRPAPRPRYSVLDNRRLREDGFGDLPEWRVALEEYLRSILGTAAAQHSALPDGR
jgi:dTDP-4-dehydrorhamnose reductase